MLPSASITTGTTSAFNFHSFPNSIYKSWYLSIFSCSFTMIFCSPGIAMSMIKQLLIKQYEAVYVLQHCQFGQENLTRLYILHSPALNQEHAYAVCHYILGRTFSIVANQFSLLLYYAFSVLVMMCVSFHHLEKLWKITVRENHFKWN